MRRRQKEEIAHPDANGAAGISLRQLCADSRHLRVHHAQSPILRKHAAGCRHFPSHEAFPARWPELHWGDGLRGKGKRGTQRDTPASLPDL